MKRQRKVKRSTLTLNEGEAAITFKPDGRHGLTLPQNDSSFWAETALWMFVRMSNGPGVD